MTRLTKALAAIAIVASPLAAHAQEGFTWQAHIDLSSDPFQSRILLAFGLPESDAVQMLARCQIGAGGPYAQVTLAADTAGLPNGAATEMGFTDGAGATTGAPATIIGVGAEVGITGVEMALELDDPLFNLMRARPVLSYAVPGGVGAEIATAGIHGPLDQFLTACADPVANAAPIPDGSSCDSIAGLVSQNGDTPQRVTFTNGGDGYRALIWVDYQGNPVQIGEFQPGQSITVDTFLTHPWMVTDGPGNCLEAMVPRAGEAQYTFTAPGQFFGNE